MVLPTSLTENEVVLGAYRFPIRGPVRVVKATQHPGKVTIGKTSRADQVLADEWVQDDWRDGMLIAQLDEQVHRGRFYWATVDTRIRRKMVLLPEYVSIGNPTATDTVSDCDFIIEFNNLLFFSFAGRIYSWDNTTLWSSELKNIGGAPTDGVVFKGKLYLARGGSYWIYDPTQPAESQWTQVNTPVTFFAQFDSSANEKLLAYDSTGLIKASANGTTWVTTVGAQTNDLTVNKLVVFRNPADEPTLFIAHTKGLHSTDVWTKTTYQTSLSILSNPEAGKGTLVWTDGNLYFPDGLALWRYPRIGQITNVGLDREDGLPTFIRGRIINLSPTPNYILATIDSTTLSTTVTETLFLGMEFGVSTIPRAHKSGYSALLAWNGTGWHTLYLSELSSSGINASLLTTVYNNERRLFICDGQGIRYILLPEGNYDPSQDPNATFRQSGEFITSWFDGGYAEISKLAVSLKGRTLNITNTETIDIYYGLNDNENFTYLNSITPSVVDSSGKTTLTINEPNGLQFYTIRFKFVFNRGTDNSKTPVFLFFDLRYKRMPDTLWGWTFTVVGTDATHLTDLWTAVKTLVENKQTVRFGFRAAEEEEKIVEVVGISGIRHTASEATNYFTVTVVELENN